MNYTYTGINPVYDASKNITEFKANFTANGSDGNYLSGSVSITKEQMLSTGFDTAKINALIGPAVQAMVDTTTTTTTA